MSELEKCYRCDEQIPPVDLSKDWPHRFRGTVVHQTHKIKLSLIDFARNAFGRGLPEVSNTELVLCDGCWGDLLSWANAPQQERLEIAAKNRRMRQREIDVAEERRERDIQKLLMEGTDQ